MLVLTAKLLAAAVPNIFEVFITFAPLVIAQTGLLCLLKSQW